MGHSDDIDHVEDAGESQRNEIDGVDYAPPEIQKEAHILEDPEYVRAQKKYLRKLDCIILPAISALYFFEYLDRGNIAVSFTSLFKGSNADYFRMPNYWGSALGTIPTNSELVRAKQVLHLHNGRPLL
jgi:hypothetical protein